MPAELAVRPAVQSHPLHRGLELLPRGAVQAVQRGVPPDAADGALHSAAPMPRCPGRRDRAHGGVVREGGRLRRRGQRGRGRRAGSVLPPLVRRLDLRRRRRQLRRGRGMRRLRRRQVHRLHWHCVSKAHHPVRHAAVLALTTVPGRPAATVECALEALVLRLSLLRCDCLRDRVPEERAGRAVPAGAGAVFPRAAVPAGALLHRARAAGAGAGRILAGLGLCDGNQVFHGQHVGDLAAGHARSASVAAELTGNAAHGAGAGAVFAPAAEGPLGRGQSLPLAGGRAELERLSVPSGLMAALVVRRLAQEAGPRRASLRGPGSGTHQAVGEVARPAVGTAGVVQTLPPGELGAHVLVALLGNLVLGHPAAQTWW
mmetsp:Transcript_60508/g.190202  ORF Transcript_60508/g.190202 Transcript_60508/m.190202 type:complete len:373 (+) Transcript_60508:487-1605(+)